MIKVSLVTGIYNKANYIEKCVESMIAQTYENIQIILFNNASTDNSQEVIDRLAVKYPDKIKAYKTDVNLGAGGGRNRGMEFSDGDYVCFIDSDDTLGPNYVKDLVDAAMRENKLPDIVMCNFQKVTEDGKILYKRCFFNKEEALMQNIAPWAKMFNKSYMQKNGLVLRNMPFGEDVIFAAELFFTKPSIALSEGYGYFWLDNATSTSHTEIRNFPNGALDKAIEYFDYIKEKYLDDQKWMSYFVLKYMVWYLMQSGRNTKSKRMKEQYDIAFLYLDKNFSDYLNNPHLTLTRPKGERTVLRVVLWCVVLMKKMGIARWFFSVYSNLNVDRFWPSL